MKSSTAASLHEISVYMPSSNLRHIIQRFEFHSISDEHPLDREVALFPGFDTGFIFSFYRYEPFMLKHEHLVEAKTPETSLTPPVSIYGYNYGARGMEIIRVVFYPGVLAMLYNKSMHQYENIFANVSELMDKEIYLLHEQLESLKDHTLQMGMIEQFLIRKLCAVSPKKGSALSGSRLFKPLCDLFEQRGYNDRAATIAKEFGWVARNFNRHLNREIGFSFDTFRRVHRFMSVARYLQHTLNAKLVEVAYQFDFTDQAHFNKEFKRMSGLSPRQYIQGVHQHRIIHAPEKDASKYESIMMSDS